MSVSLSEAVIRDLMPAYLAGDACVETRAIVDQALQGNPGLRASVEAATQDAVPPLEPPAALRREALQRSQGALARRAPLAALTAFFFTAALLCLGDRSPWSKLAHAGGKPLSVACIVAGFVCAALFLHACRQSGALALPPHRTWTSRWAWIAMGYLSTLAAATILESWTGLDLLPFLGIAGAVIAVSVGERFRQIVTAEELFKPASLSITQNSPEPRP
jgi:hypothetical protein